MTAHRCCPECGAELTADGGKFCGCVGPFTAEHVDPMHIRPYVDLPEPEDEEAPPPDLEPFARCGQAETAELPALSEYENPFADRHESPYANSLENSHGDDHGDSRGDPYRGDGHGPYGEPLRGPYAGPGDGHRDGVERDGVEEEEPAPAAGAAAVSLSRGGSHRRGKGRGAYVYGRDEGAGKRRRPLKAALAAAGAVAALGGGLLTTQALTGEQGSDRNLSADDTAPPDGFSGGPTEDPSRTDGDERDKKPSKKQTSRTGSADARADRDGGERSERAPAPSRTSSSTAPGTPSSPEDGGDRDDDRDHGWNGGGWGGWNGGGSHDGDRDRPRPPQESTQPGGETLRPGDRGPEVAELQSRLKQAGALDEDAPEDGVYSQQVQQAVAQYQARNEVRGDEYGEYGPNTRRVLESQTQG